MEDHMPRLLVISHPTQIADAAPCAPSRTRGSVAGVLGAPVKHRRSQASRRLLAAHLTLQMCTSTQHRRRRISARFQTIFSRTGQSRLQIVDSGGSRFRRPFAVHVTEAPKLQSRLASRECSQLCGCLCVCSRHCPSRKCRIVLPTIFNFEVILTSFE